MGDANAHRLGVVEEALSGISQGLLIATADAVVAFANDRYRRFFGLRPDEVQVGDSLESVLMLLARRGAYGAGVPEEQVKDRMLPFENRETYTLDREMNDGRSLNITGTPLESGGYVYTFTDVTERVRRNDHLQKVVEERTSALREAIERLHQLATSDSLTGAENRRRFDERHLEVEARARRYGIPYSLAILDIDHFKTVNDTYGHQAGDDVLVELVRRLKERIRETDSVARFGGEEFVLLFPDTTLTEAEILTEGLRQIVAAQSFMTSETSLRITISIGVAQWRATVEDRDQVVQAADAALYEAKQAGRNRVATAAE